MTTAKQAEIMKDQLKEMQAEQRPYIWVANTPASAPTISASGVVMWNIYYTNTGKTPANNLRFINRFIRVAGGAFRQDAGFMRPSNDSLGSPLPPGNSNFISIVSPFTLNDEEIFRVQRGTGGITVAADVLYEDKFGHVFETDICMTRLATGAVMYINASIGDIICKNEMK